MPDLLSDNFFQRGEIFLFPKQQPVLGFESGVERLHVYVAFGPVLRVGNANFIQDSKFIEPARA
jgi:hypothetical protein